MEAHRSGGVASRVHTAPAQLFNEHTNNSNDNPAEAPTSTSKSKWKKVATLGLAFAGNLGRNTAGSLDLLSHETWADASSSEDEGAVRRYEDSDDSDVDEEGVEEGVVASVPKSCRTFERINNNVMNGNDAKEHNNTPVTSLIWAYQNLNRVPPGMWRVFHVERLTGLDLSHNSITTVPSALGRFVNLETLDVSHNLLKSVPRALIRCRRLHTLRLSHNKLTHIGTWVSNLPKLKTLELGGNPGLIDPPKVVYELGFNATIEYLRSVQISQSWSANEVVDVHRVTTTNREISRISLPAAARERRRNLKLHTLDTFKVDRSSGVDSGDNEDKTSDESKKNAHSHNVLQLAFSVKSKNAHDVPSFKSERAKELITELAVKNSGKGLRYCIFRPGFFSEFRRINTIDLTDSRLTNLPASLGSLCNNLEALVLDGNCLTSANDSIPNLSGLHKLKMLSLSNNKTLTAFPDWLDTLTKLETLIVSGCNLVSDAEGTVKLKSLRKCKALFNLNVGKNTKMRSLPLLPLQLKTLSAEECVLEFIESITDAYDLRELNLRNNRLRQLPEDIGDLNFLTHLDLRNNFLKSIDAPNMDRRAGKFVSLKFSSNPLGYVPWWLADVPSEALERRVHNERTVSFEVRDRWRADDDDAIDADVHHSKKLVSLSSSALNLSNRYLLYTPSIEKFQHKLTRLNLSHNHLGFLPGHLSSLTNLTELLVNDNELTYLPDLSSLENLKNLRAQNNNLQMLPTSLGKLNNMTDIYAGNNRDITQIPNLSNCTKLETLVIDRCSVSVLPTSLAAAPNLRKLYVEGNPLTFPSAEIYEKGGNVAVLKFLKDVYRTEVETREMNLAREAFAKDLARKRNGEQVGGDTDSKDVDYTDSKTNISPGSSSKTPPTKQKSLGALLWRDARRVVVHDTETLGEQSKYGDGKFDAEDAVFKAKSIKAGVRKHAAREELGKAQEDLVWANSHALKTGNAVVQFLEHVKALRVKSGEQKRLLMKFPTMSPDALVELQENLRAAKKELKESSEAKSEADSYLEKCRVHVEQCQLDVETIILEVKTVTQEMEAMKLTRREEVMRVRKERVDDTKRKAQEGALDATIATKQSSLNIRQKRTNLKRESSRKLIGGKHHDLGYQRTDITNLQIEDSANKGWGKAQVAMRLGMFAGGVDRVDEESGR